MEAICGNCSKVSIFRDSQSSSSDCHVVLNKRKNSKHESTNYRFFSSFSFLQQTQIVLNSIMCIPIIIVSNCNLRMKLINIQHNVRIRIGEIAFP